jgi:hypothetical protein
MSKLRERLAEVVDLVRKHNGRVSIDAGRRHIALTVVDAQGRPHRVVMARTPSDWRGDLNMQARIRRVLRCDGPQSA